MEVLPLHILDHQRDGIFFGEDIINLSKLVRGDFPIPKGFVITPPEIIIQTVLKHLETVGSEVIEQSLTLINSEINNIPQSLEFDKEFKDTEIFLFNKEVIHQKNLLWNKLLKFWINQIKNKILTLGFGKNLTSILSPVVVFKVPNKNINFKNSKLDFISAFYDPGSLDVVIVSEKKLDPIVLKQIDTLVILGNKKLFLPQNYHFLLADKLYLINVSPFTQGLKGSEDMELIVPKKEILNIKKSSVKVFYDLSVGFTTPGYLDGVLIDGTKFSDLESLTFKITETALSFPQKSLIFKLPSQKVESFLEHLNYLYKQKYLQNIELCLPNIFSPHQIGEMKQKLVSVNPPRLWVEIFTPESLLNFEAYSKYNFDGVIINLDLLQRHLVGELDENIDFDRSGVVGLINILHSFLKLSHQQQKFTLVFGRVTLNPEVLDFLVSNGIWGIVSNNLIEAHSLPEYLNWVEDRIVRKQVLD